MGNILVEIVLALVIILMLGLAVGKPPKEQGTSVPEAWTDLKTGLALESALREGNEEGEGEGFKEANQKGER